VLVQKKILKKKELLSEHRIRSVKVGETHTECSKTKKYFEKDPEYFRQHTKKDPKPLF